MVLQWLPVAGGPAGVEWDDPLPPHAGYPFQPPARRSAKAPTRTTPAAPEMPTDPRSLRLDTGDQNERRSNVSAHFEVYEDKAHQWRFRLKAGNGEIVAVGESYPTRSGAEKGCDAVKRAAAEADIVEAKAA